MCRSRVDETRTLIVLQQPLEWQSEFMIGDEVPGVIP